MKKLLLILLPLLLVLGVGGTVGAAFFGYIRVPFLPFGKKKGPPPPVDDGKGGPFAPLLAMAPKLAAEVEASKPKKPPTPPPPPTDPGPGEDKLAALWGQMPTDRLVAVTEKWPLPLLGQVLSRMDEEPVANLLAALPPEKASSVSRAIADATSEQASKVHQNDTK